MKFKYRHANIYELRQADMGTFDIVLFLGVLYHLPDMVRALAIVRDLCDGVLFLETDAEPDLVPGLLAHAIMKRIRWRTILRISGRPTRNACLPCFETWAFLR